jgi:ATP-dependent protease ClpP protease subunit
MAIWHRLDDAEKKYRPMHIIVDSPGGSVIDGMHLFDQMVTYSERGGGPHKITITVRGYAASMAGILLQAADVRKIGPESYLMIHEVSSFAAGKIGELKDEIKFLDKISDRVANIFVERSKKKISLAKFKSNWNRQDWWLTSKEALDYGFVDEIG